MRLLPRVVWPARGLPQPLLRLRPWRQPECPLPGLVIHLVGVDIVAVPAAAVDSPRTVLDFDVLGMTLVSQQEPPMAASCWPSSIMWWSLTMGALALLPRLLFHCGSRLHHLLPTSPGCPCSLRDEVLSLYPTTGSAFPMGMVQRSRLCRSVHSTAGPLLFKHRTSGNSARTMFAE